MGCKIGMVIGFCAYLGGPTLGKLLLHNSIEAKHVNLQLHVTALTSSSFSKQLSTLLDGHFLIINLNYMTSICFLSSRT